MIVLLYISQSYASKSYLLMKYDINFTLFFLCTLLFVASRLRRYSPEVGVSRIMIVSDHQTAAKKNNHTRFHVTNVTHS